MDDMGITATPEAHPASSTAPRPQGASGTRGWMGLRSGTADRMTQAAKRIRWTNADRRRVGSDRHRAANGPRKRPPHRQAHRPDALARPARHPTGRNGPRPVLRLRAPPGVAATLEGVDFIGCELDPEYAEIARARIEWWSQFPPGTEVEAALGIEVVDRVHRESGPDGAVRRMIGGRFLSSWAWRTSTSWPGSSDGFSIPPRRNSTRRRRW